MDIKFSSYNFPFEAQGGKYVYNIYTTAIISTDEKLFSAIQAKDLSLVEAEFVSDLLECGILTPNSTDEREEYRYYYDNARLYSRSNCLSLCFVPSYNCNLACPYCIQGSGKLAKRMSQENINSVIKYISNEVENRQDTAPIQYLYISLYGGEPTMNVQDLSVFCNSLDEIAKKHNIELSFDMTTNLTLLNSELLDLIEKYKIRLQVSIDGTREQHNVRRIFKNGEGTYDLIINNLKKLNSRGLKELITLRLNIDEDNLASAEEIADAVKEYSDDLYFGFLAKYKGFNDEYTSCISEACYSAVATSKLNGVMRRLGYVVPATFGRKAPCSISTMNKLYIDCYMNVYKCEMLLNQPECKVGTISENGNFIPNGNYYKQMSFSPFLFEKCVNCKFLPLCGGGCPGKAYVNGNVKNGEIRSPSCQIDDQTLLVYLQDYVQNL